MLEPALPVIEKKEHRKGNAADKQDVKTGYCQIVSFGSKINSQRQGLRFAGNVAGDHDGRAKLSQGAGEGKDAACGDSGPGQGQGNSKEDAQLAGAKGACRIFQMRIDAVQRSFGILLH